LPRLRLLRLLLRFLPCQMVAHDATGRGAQYRMMACHVSCYRPDRGALDTSLCLDAARCRQ